MPPIVRATLEHVIVPLSIKADAVNPTDRTFEGLSATWDIDLGNDRIKRGAFKQAIADWKSGTEAIPLLNSHDHYDIFSAIGQLVDAQETKDGLWSKWEVLDGVEGDAVLQRLRPSRTTGRPTVGKMSIGYVPLEYSYEQPEDSSAPWDRIRNLLKIDWQETSLVLFPMNPGASVDASTVKTMLLAMKHTNPEALTDDMRSDMRRLASRIGRLLKTTPTPPTPTPTAPPSTSTPTTPAPSTPSPTPAPAPTTPTPTPPVTPPSTPVTPAPTAGAKADSGDPVIYEYQDALTQRLQKTLLTAKVSEIKVPHA